MINFARIEKGARIELVSTADPYTALKAGALGTVTRVMTQLNEQVIEVDWDCGSRLSMIPAQGDRFNIL